MKTARAIVLIVLSIAFACASAQVGKWPERPVRIIVPLAPGGSVDMLARMVAGRLAERLGQQFVVDNRPGAGTTIGVAIAARANPDGHTLLMMSSAYAASAALYKLPYDPIKDIAPITTIAAGPMFLFVHPAVKAANLKEFVELARSSPGALRYGSGGVGSSTHLAAELFAQLAKLEVVHVPYKGVGAALADLLSGQLHMYIGPGPALLPHVATGKLRVLAITSERRVEERPDLPAINEVVPGYAATFWYGMGLPAGTPAHVIASLNQEIANVLTQPDLQKRLRADELKPAPSTPNEFTVRIRGDIAIWSRVIKSGNIKLE